MPHDCPLRQLTCLSDPRQRRRRRRSKHLCLRPSKGRQQREYQVSTSCSWRLKRLLESFMRLCGWCKVDRHVCTSEAIVYTITQKQAIERRSLVLNTNLCVLCSFCPLDCCRKRRAPVGLSQVLWVPMWQQCFRVKMIVRE